MKLESIVRNKNLVSFLGYGLTAVFEFLIIIILARSYSKVLFGDWMLYTNAAFVFDLMLNGMISNALVCFLAGASTEKEQGELIGSAWILYLILLVSSTCLIYAVYGGFQRTIDISGFYLFFHWYPFLALAKLPFNISLNILKFHGRFARIILLRLISLGSFCLLLLLNAYFWKVEIYIIAFMQIACFGAASLFAVINGSSGAKYLFRSRFRSLKKLFHYGKYSLGTSVNSQLLISSDVFLIGSLMGSEYVASYEVALKLMSFFNIPLFSLVAVAFPRMTRMLQQKKTDDARKIFHDYAGATSLLFIPFIIILFIFAKPVVFLLGGEKYIASGLSVSILRILLFSCLFISIDRFTGVALESMKNPQINFFKTLCMLIINIGGDLVAICCFQSLTVVAFVTILNILFGFLFGFFVLRSRLGIRFRYIFSSGFDIIKDTLFRGNRL